MIEQTMPLHHLLRRHFARPRHAADLLTHFLPATVVGLLDTGPSSIAPRAETLIGEDGTEHDADLVLQVGLRDGGRAAVCVVFVHTYVPADRLAFQLLQLMVRVWEADLRAGSEPSAPIPLVIYVGQESWPATETGVARGQVGPGLSPYSPALRFEFADMSRCEQGDGRIAVMMWAMRYPLAEEVLKYVMEASEYLTLEETRVAVEQGIPGMGGDIVMTIAETMREEGWRQGFLAGIGVALELRLGTAGVGLLPELAEIEDTATLKAAGDAVLLARTPEDVRAVYRRAAA